MSYGMKRGEGNEHLNKVCQSVQDKALKMSDSRDVKLGCMCLPGTVWKHGTHQALNADAKDVGEKIVTGEWFMDI